MKQIRIIVQTKAYHVDTTLPESKVIPYVKRLLATYNQLPWPLRGGFHVIFERVKPFSLVQDYQYSPGTKEMLKDGGYED